VTNHATLHSTCTCASHIFSPLAPNPVIISHPLETRRRGSTVIVWFSEFVDFWAFIISSLSDSGGVVGAY
jgi:hypothetical protein